MNQTLSIAASLLLLLTLFSDSSLAYDFSSEIHFLKCLTEKFKSSPGKQLVFSSHTGNYSSVLNAYVRNLRFATLTTPKPSFIVTPITYDQVSAVVLCARNASYQLRIRSGGHDYEGLSYVSHVPFVLLDLNLLREIKIDVKSESAWVQAGATVGELYYKIAQASNVLAFPAGFCTTLGIGGHFTGGGYGALARKYGLAIDHIVDATLVDVNGKILDRKAMGEDLFWAIRGGGAASFGVVLSWKINLVRVPEKVSMFSVIRTFEQGAINLVDKWQQLTAADKLDKDLFIRVTFKPVDNTLVTTFTGTYLGSALGLVYHMNREFPELRILAADVKEGNWANSTLFWAGSLGYGSIAPTMEALLNRTSAYEIFLKQHSDYAKTLIPKEGLKDLWNQIILLGPLHIIFSPYGGKMSEIPESDTPFPHRNGNLFQLQYVSYWKDEQAGGEYMKIVDDMYNFLTPYVSRQPRETDLNYRDLDIGTNSNRSLEFGYKYFKKNFDRLIKIKTAVDPQNFFQYEQSIPTQRTFRAHRS